MEEQRPKRKASRGGGIRNDLTGDPQPGQRSQRPEASPGWRRQSPGWVTAGQHPSPPTLVSDLAFACLAFPACRGNWSFRVGFQATLLAMSNAAGWDWKVTSAQGLGTPLEPPSCPSLPAANPDTRVPSPSPAWGSSWLPMHALASLSHQARCPPGCMWPGPLQLRLQGEHREGSLRVGASCFAWRGGSLPVGPQPAPQTRRRGWTHQALLRPHMSRKLSNLRTRRGS